MFVAVCTTGKEYNKKIKTNKEKQMNDEENYLLKGKILSRTFRIGKQYCPPPDYLRNHSSLKLKKKYIFSLCDD